MRYLIKTEFDGLNYKIKYLDGNRWREDWLIYDKSHKKEWEKMIYKIRNFG